MRTINSLHKPPIIQMIENRTLTSLRLAANQPEDHCRTCNHLCALPRSKLRLNLSQRKVNTRSVARRLAEVSSLTPPAGVRAAAFTAVTAADQTRGCNPISLSSLLMSRVRLTSTVPGILALNHAATTPHLIIVLIIRIVCGGTVITSRVRFDCVKVRF